MNSWIKILQAFRNGYFPWYDYGLTLRFILGVCQIPIGKKFETAEQAKEAALQMFNEMKVYSEDNLVVTSNICGIHRGSVMCFTDTKWSDKTIGTTFEEIWNRYGEEIINGDYHISKEEREVVERIFPDQPSTTKQ